MASYFEEHDCDEAPAGAAELPPPQALLELARSLFSGLELDGAPAWEQRLPPPAARHAVQALPSVRVTAAQAEKSLKCPVCLVEFEEDEVVREMPCRHLFHQDCILPWLGKTNSCPLCRHELPTDDKQYEEYKKDKLRQQQQAHRLEYLHGAMYT